jgi:hypothetical protein
MARQGKTVRGHRASPNSRRRGAHVREAGTRPNRNERRSKQELLAHEGTPPADGCRSGRPGPLDRQPRGSASDRPVGCLR